MVTRSSLNYANFERANLVEAKLKGCSLIDANLRGADLRSANLNNADLRGACLRDASLMGASLESANLCQADLTGATLTNNELEGAILGWTILQDGAVSHSPAMDLIASKLEHLKRQAWRPVTAYGNSDIEAFEFAGNPWLSAEESYPLCPRCQNPLRFFLQINLEKLPEAARSQFGNGLLQLFCCANEDAGCIDDGWEPFSTCKLVRIVQPGGAASSAELPVVDWKMGAALIEGEFPKKHIVGWQEIRTYLEWHEVESSKGLRLSRDESEILSAAGVEHESFGCEISDFMDTTRMCPVEGDRLAGYPRWLQYAEYPNCPICDRLMDQLIFELTSDDNLP